MRKHRAIKDNLTVFDFSGYFEGDMDFVQHRFVVAETEEEAVEKMEQYVEELVNSGCARFIFDYNPTVEVDFIIG